SEMRRSCVGGEAQRRFCVQCLSSVIFSVPVPSGDGRATSVQSANLFICEGESTWPKLNCSVNSVDGRCY
ncbi:MAG: hypothetical protein ACK55Z_02610, partial [bacterium]